MIKFNVSVHFSGIFFRQYLYRKRMLLAFILYLFSIDEMSPGTEGGTRWSGVYISSVSCSDDLHILVCI